MTKEGFGRLVSLEEAIRLVNENIPGLGDEEVKIPEALNRILAEDVVAGIDVPHFRKSAMDGFAVIARDTFGAGNTSPRELTIVDSISAGVVSRKKVVSGSCVELTTGAPMPEGADAVLMVEYTEREGDKLVIYKGVTPTENVIGVGSDVASGTKVFSKGTRLNPRYTGVLSSLGLSGVFVKKKPKVAVLSTGNEVMSAGTVLKKGKIYDINSRTLIDSLRERDCEVVDLGVARDNEKEIRERISEGVKASDLVLVSGGSSLGTEDLLVDVITRLGELLVHGIAVKPGKPTIIGRVKNRLVIGLPGYPTSALSNFYILIIPLLERMQGITSTENLVEAKLTRKIASTIGRYEFLSVKITTRNNKRYAEPVLRGSSAITTLANADGFVAISENTEVVNKGEIVEVNLF
ncbi:MAG: gephyrin-like molybdotransferase Glp [Candidatus Altiarchaeota archaeon]|nr:gephyrin-like molybdotransferase Glp [Candidatus Altiarchaeota archaeon]